MYVATHRCLKLPYISVETEIGSSILLERIDKFYYLAVMLVPKFE